MKRERSIVADEAAKVGVRTSPQGKTYRPGVLFADPLMTGRRWMAATKRVAQILSGSGRASTITASAANADSPRLAREFSELYAYYMTRDRPAPLRGTDHNPFRGMSDRDASRRFIRMVEDICDRSTGRLGPWWVR